MEIVAVGAGALGSWTLDIMTKRLVALGLKPDVRIIDFDVVDDRNFANQFFTKAHKGKYKCDVMADRLSQYGVKATAVPEKLTEDNIEQLIVPAKTRIVIDMVDNVEARTLLWMYSVSYNKACLHAGVAKEGHGKAIWTTKGYDHWFSDGIKGRLQGNSTQDAESAKDEKLPPCEMLEFASLCIQTSMATAQAVTMYYGKDPEAFFKGADVPMTTMVNYRTFADKHYVDAKKGCKIHDEEAEPEPEEPSQETPEEGEAEDKNQDPSSSSGSEEVNEEPEPEEAAHA